MRKHLVAAIVMAQLAGACASAPSPLPTRSAVAATSPPASTSPTARPTAIPSMVPTTMPATYPPTLPDPAFTTRPATTIGDTWIGLDWHRLDPSDPIVNIRTITAWSGGFVALGAPVGDGRAVHTPVWTSGDGANWTPVQLPFGPGAITSNVVEVDGVLAAITLQGTDTSECEPVRSSWLFRARWPTASVVVDQRARLAGGRRPGRDPAWTRGLRPRSARARGERRRRTRARPGSRCDAGPPSQRTVLAGSPLAPHGRSAPRSIRHAVAALGPRFVAIGTEGRGKQRYGRALRDRGRNVLERRSLSKRRSTRRPSGSGSLRRQTGSSRSARSAAPPPRTSGGAVRTVGHWEYLADYPPLGTWYGHRAREWTRPQRLHGRRRAAHARLRRGRPAESVDLHERHQLVAAGDHRQGAGHRGAARCRDVRADSRWASCSSSRDGAAWFADPLID